MKCTSVRVWPEPRTSACGRLAKAWSTGSTSEIRAIAQKDG